MLTDVPVLRSGLLLPPVPDFIGTFYCATHTHTKSTDVISWSETWPLRSRSAFFPLYNPGNVCVDFKEHFCVDRVSSQNSRKGLIRITILTGNSQNYLISSQPISQVWKGTRRKKPSYCASPPCEHLQEFCCSAQTRKLSQHRNVLFIDHTYMGTVHRSLCMFLSQVLTAKQQMSCNPKPITGLWAALLLEEVKHLWL